jgi:hypothetical protein
MPNAAEMITSFAEYIAFSNTWGVEQHAGRGLTIELKGHSAK